MRCMHLLLLLISCIAAVRMPGIMIFAEDFVDDYSRHCHCLFYDESAIVRA